MVADCFRYLAASFLVLDCFHEIPLFQLSVSAAQQLCWVDECVSCIAIFLNRPIVSATSCFGSRVFLLRWSGWQIAFSAMEACCFHACVLFIFLLSGLAEDDLFRPRLWFILGFIFLYFRSVETIEICLKMNDSAMEADGECSRASGNVVLSRYSWKPPITSQISDRGHEISVIGQLTDTAGTLQAGCVSNRTEESKLY